MNSVHLHLMLNHFPVAGSFLCTILLFAGLYMKSAMLRNTALCGFILVALFTIPVFISGNEAEETVENISGISEQSIETHEEAGELGLWLVIGLGIISSLGFLMRKNEKLYPVFNTIIIVAAIGVNIFMYKVGNSGGAIRHPEISNNALQNQDQNTESHSEESE